MIKKTIFRNEIKQLLVHHMLEGKVEVNQRLSLPELAAAMDTSVTPVREALTQLTETGIVLYKPNRGFFVAQLDDQKAIEIYQLIRLLESEALRSSYFSQEDLNELRAINEQFLAAEDNLSRIQLDTSFHQALIQNYTNQTSIKIIEDLRIRISIHELKFMNALPSKKSWQMHENIIEHLKNDDIHSAINELNSNWETSIESISNLTK
ncbi:MAG: GntR family transcriptional regulator [Crocinitomicaceae bacterium]